MNIEGPVRPGNLADDLLNLRPWWRVQAGLALLAIGGALSVWLWGAGFVWGFGLFLTLLGVVGVGSGLIGLRHERTVAAEVARAEAQWADLRRELELAKRTGQGIGKTLTRLGYHDLGVRSWIRSELGIDPPAPELRGTSDDDDA